MANPATDATVIACCGCDFSTHAVHLALVTRDRVEAQKVIGLDGNFNHQAQLLDAAFNDWQPGFGCAPALVIEQAFHHFEHSNPDTTIKLAMTMGFIIAMAARHGYTIYRLSPSEWRSLAGVPIHHKGSPGMRKRADLKSAAIALVKQEYGLDVLSDDAAEAILMGRVGVGLLARDSKRDS